MSLVSISDLHPHPQAASLPAARSAGPPDSLPAGYVHDDAIGLLTLQLLEGRSEDVIGTVDRLLDTFRDHEHSGEGNDLRILRGLAELDMLSATAGGRTPASETALRFALRILPTLERLVATDAHHARALGPVRDRRPTPKLASPPTQPLSRREKEILVLTELGLSNKEIGSQLWISEGTVKKHQSNTFMKLNVRNRTEAVVKARQIGIF